MLGFQNPPPEKSTNLFRVRRTPSSVFGHCGVIIVARRWNHCYCDFQSVLPDVSKLFTTNNLILRLGCSYYTYVLDAFWSHKDGAATRAGFRFCIIELQFSPIVWSPRGKTFYNPLALSATFLNRTMGAVENLKTEVLKHRSQRAKKVHLRRKFLNSLRYDSESIGKFSGMTPYTFHPSMPKVTKTIFRSIILLFFLYKLTSKMCGVRSVALKMFCCYYRINSNEISNRNFELYPTANICFYV